MKLLNRESSRLWRHILLPVSDDPRPSLDLVLIHFIGLQTPRLKRLAEIVSAQAMAQQEGGMDGAISDTEGP